MLHQLRLLMLLPPSSRLSIKHRLAKKLLLLKKSTILSIFPCPFMTLIFPLQLRRSARLQLVSFLSLSSFQFLFIFPASNSCDLTFFLDPTEVAPLDTDDWSDGESAAAAVATAPTVTLPDLQVAAVASFTDDSALAPASSVPAPAVLTPGGLVIAAATGMRYLAFQLPIIQLPLNANEHHWLFRISALPINEIDSSTPHEPPTDKPSSS